MVARVASCSGCWSNASFCDRVEVEGYIRLEGHMDGVSAMLFLVKVSIDLTRAKYSRRASPISATRLLLVPRKAKKSRRATVEVDAGKRRGDSPLKIASMAICLFALAPCVGYARLRKISISDLGHFAVLVQSAEEQLAKQVKGSNRWSE